MQNRRMIFDKRLHLIARKGQCHPQSIAIVVVSYVMPPVNQRRRGFIRISFAIVVSVNHPVTAIDLKRWSNQDDDVFADRLYERSLLSRERSEEHTSELQSQFHLVCRLLLEKKKK